MNPLVGLQTGWTPPSNTVSWQQGMPGLMGNVLQQPSQQAGLMGGGSLPSLQGVQPGDWSSVAYNMAGRPNQGPSPTAPGLPMPPGVSANGSSSSGGGSSVGGTALGILGALAKNPALLKSAGNGVSSLWNSLTGGGAAGGSVLAGGSPALSAVGTGAVAPAVDSAAADASAALGGADAAGSGAAAGGGLLGAGAVGSGAVGAAGANALAASGGFATGGAAGAGGGTAAGTGAAAGLAGIASVAALPALAYLAISMEKPGTLENLDKNYMASGQVASHTDPQLAAQYSAALLKAQAGGGMGSIAPGAAVKDNSTYYTTANGKRLDSTFTPWQAAQLYNAAYVDPKLASQANVNAYLTYMQQHGG